MLPARSTPIVYPSRDGKRLADNTLRFRWIVTLQGGLDALFHDDPNVFVAGDLLWYPVEGVTEIAVAPDVMVVFGRPKRDRKSYLQWEEDDVAPQVVFEIVSESNDPWEMAEKQDFYEDHGVQESYVYYPRLRKLRGMYREGSIFRRIRQIQGWQSPLLKVRFSMEDDLVIHRPDGRRFLSFTELVQHGEREFQRAENERERAEKAEQKNRELLALLRDKGMNPVELPEA